MEGPTRRLDHGFEYLRALAKEVGRFMARDPYVFRREVEAETGNHVWRAEIRATPPPEMSLIAGDCVHSLRSALDNLAWALGCAHKDPPPARLAFPVCLKAKMWRDSQWKVRAMLPAARKVIDAVQPYHRPEADRLQHPLWVLDRLWNDDKHRVPAVVGGLNVGSRLNIIELVGGPFSDHIEVGPLYEGKEVARCVVPQGPDAKVNIEAEFAVSVAFEDGTPSLGLPLIETLHSLHDFVRNEVFAGIEAEL